MWTIDELQRLVGELYLQLYQQRQIIQQLEAALKDARSEPLPVAAPVASMRE